MCLKNFNQKQTIEWYLLSVIFHICCGWSLNAFPGEMNIFNNWIPSTAYVV